MLLSGGRKGRRLASARATSSQLGDEIMATRELARSEWQSYFDRMSESLRATQVGIEVASLSIGDQVVANQAALTGITYDPKCADLMIITESLEHVIYGPNEIFVQESDDGVASIEALDSADTKHIVTLTPRLMIAGSAA
jgi:hypothetical protein